MVGFYDDFSYTRNWYEKRPGTDQKWWSETQGIDIDEIDLGDYASWRDWKSIYGTVLKGTKAAEEQARLGALQKFMARAQGASATQRERVSSLEGEITASGLSPEQVRRIVQEEESRVPLAVGQARAETQGELRDTLGELYKGTASEIAGLQVREKSLGHQDYLASRARRQARKAGKRAFQSKLLGTAITGAAMYFGGPAAGAAAGAFSSGASGGSFLGTPGGGVNYGYNPYMGSTYGY